MHRFRRLFLILSMASICLGFVTTVFSSLTYMAKDYNAYNSVYAFFGVSTNARLALTRLPISQLMTLRLLNLSHIAFVLASVMFALLFFDQLPRWFMRLARLFTTALALVQLIFMDPQYIIWIYLNGIGPFVDIFLFRGFYQVLNTVLRYSAICELLFAAVLLLIAFLRTPRTIRAYPGLVALLFCGLTAVYLYLYQWLPVQVLWLSRVAQYVGFGSLPVNRPTPFNTYAPLFSVLFVVSFSLMTCLTLLRNSRERHYEQAFRSKVSAVETVSRVFCHYLKNELLSQQAELKLLSVKVDPALREDVAFIIARNDEIYKRLSAVRDTMKQQKMPLERLDLAALMRGVIAQIELPEPLSVRVQMPEDAIRVMGNADQLREVLICLVRNALEVDRAGDALRIFINIVPLRQYVSIAVSNDGPRIKRDEWSAIFDPFFTTKPTKSNWGLGLALCKNVIALHRGRIWMDEETIDGEPMTTFHILLPLAD